VTRRYSQTKYIASFAGFAPVDNPEIACIVSIDEPIGAHQGGSVAAPVFARVVSDTLRALGVPPEDDPQSSLASDFQIYDLPDFLKENKPSAVDAADDSRPALDVADDANVSDESNAGDNASKRYGSIVVPDLTGLGIREAVALCAARGLKIKPSGDGIVSSQSPPPGSLIAQEAICHVRLSKLIDKKEKPEPPAKSQGFRR
jgi:hypothetical protein